MPVKEPFYDIIVVSIIDLMLNLWYSYKLKQTYPAGLEYVKPIPEEEP